MPPQCRGEIPNGGRVLVKQLGDRGRIGRSKRLPGALRQLELLQAFAGSLASSVAALADTPLEVALVDLKLALALTGEILGDDVGDAVLDRIFSTFCLGK